MPRDLDYSTPCLLALDEKHQWEPDPYASDFNVMRYGCRCGARAWRQRIRLGVALPRDNPIVQYRTDSPLAEGKKCAERVVTAKPRSAGKNATGGYLPPGSSGRRG